MTRLTAKRKEFSSHGVAPYPKLLKNDVDEVIVLFSKYGVGTVVASWGPGPFSKGDHSIDWDMNEFESYVGIVELTQE